MNLSVIVDYNTSSLKAAAALEPKMSKLSIQFNDYVSLAVMLLMVVALVAGQSDASAYARDHASIVVVTESSHFRGEGE